MNRGRQRRRLALATALAMLGAGLAGTPAQAISGGEPGAFPFAARISADGVRACSGALVATQWIVTSTVCFAEEGSPVVAGAPARPTTVTIGSSVADAKTTTVTKIVPHANRGVLLAKLKSRIDGVTPVPIATAVPTTGEVLTAAGFGRTATVWVPGQLHVAPFTVQAVGTERVDLLGQGASGGICKGDAGGPLLRSKAGGQVELVAVHHTAGQAGCLAESSTSREAVDNRVDDLAAWIAQTTAYPTDSIRAFYDNTGAQTRLSTFANLTASPITVATNWTSGAGSWDATRSRAVSGDFDGNGTEDVVAFYNYNNSQTKAWLWADPDNAPTPRTIWDSGVGGWNWANATYVAGDFDGDGADEIAGFYNYGSSQTKLWIWDNVATQATPKLTWDSGTGKWDAAKAKWVVGDVDDDGKDEIAAAYDYGSSQTKFWVFDEVAGTAVPRMTWDSGAGAWNWANATYVAGDVDGDGQAEIGGFYDYGSSQTKLWIWDNVATQGVAKQAWDSGAGKWNALKAKVVSGDLDGDGRTEIGAFYDYGSSQTKLWLFDGFEGTPSPRLVWDSGTGTWDWTRLYPM